MIARIRNLFSTDSFLLFSFPLIVGWVADLIFADPARIPHPVRIFGAVISRGETLLNRGGGRFAKGALFASAFVAGVFLVFLKLENAALEAGTLFHTVFASLFVFFGLAGKGLIRECGAVFAELENGNISAARRGLSRIVGRDTEDLDAARIKTATLETMSENLSDGVVAPIFFYALGGVPAMMAYKAVNTLDSMVGYKNSRYRDFGRLPARLDDAANFIPARITSLLMAGCAFSRRGFVFIFRFAHLHPSPNAGWPQAALAGALDCRLGGPASYGGEVVQKPFIGENSRDISRGDYETAKRINHIVAAAAVALAAAFGGFF